MRGISGGTRCEVVTQQWPISCLLYVGSSGGCCCCYYPLSRFRTYCSVPRTFKVLTRNVSENISTAVNAYRSPFVCTSEGDAVFLFVFFTLNSCFATDFDSFSDTFADVPTTARLCSVLFCVLFCLFCISSTLFSDVFQMSEHTHFFVAVLLSSACVAHLLVCFL